MNSRCDSFVRVQKASESEHAQCQRAKTDRSGARKRKRKRKLKLTADKDDVEQRVTARVDEGGAIGARAVWPRLCLLRLRRRRSRRRGGGGSRDAALRAL